MIKTSFETLKSKFLSYPSYFPDVTHFATMNGTRSDWPAVPVLWRNKNRIDSWILSKDDQFFSIEHSHYPRKMDMVSSVYNNEQHKKKKTKKNKTHVFHFTSRGRAGSSPKFILITSQNMVPVTNPRDIWFKISVIGLYFSFSWIVTRLTAMASRAAVTWITKNLKRKSKGMIFCFYKYFWHLPKFIAKNFMTNYFCQHHRQQRLEVLTVD